MKEKAYTIIFTATLCASSALILTAVSSAWKEVYESRASDEKISAVLDALGLAEKGSLDRRSMHALFRERIRTTVQNEVVVYEAVQGNTVTGYAIEVAGSGLYGMVKGVLAFEPDKRTIRALRFFHQEETPGLGGRISSKEFLDGFKGKTVVSPTGELGVRLVKKASAPNEVDAITGATMTSAAVERFINKSIREFLLGRKLAPVEIALPKPRAGAAPTFIPAGSTAVLPSVEPRPPFMAPEGTRLVSKGKPVSASDEEPIVGTLSMITDGVKEAGDDTYVELGPGLQYVQIDLGAPHEIHAVVMWFFYGDARICRDVIVQASDDPAFEKDVHTLFNCDFDGSSELGKGTDREFFETYEGKLVDGRGVKARYVRVYTNGSTADEMNRYTEIEVYGIPLGGGEKP